MLIQARVDLAVRMLQSPPFDRVTTAEIGRRAGFSDGSHFTKVLRRLTGQTPMQMRRAGIRRRDDFAFASGAPLAGVHECRAFLGPARGRGREAAYFPRELSMPQGTDRRGIERNASNSSGGPEGQTSNSLLEALAGWNDYLNAHVVEITNLKLASHAEFLSGGHDVQAIARTRPLPSDG